MNGKHSIFVIIILFGSCAKKETNQLAHIDFSKDAVDWAYIPQNRYFFYKDSAIGEEDSVVCFSSEIVDKYQPAINGGGQCSYFYDQVYQLELRIDGLVPDWFYGTAYAGSPNGPCRDFNGSWINFFGNDNYCSFGTIGQFGFAFRADSANYYRNFVINGKLYNDVLITDCTDGGPGDTAQSWYFANRYYWAKGIGIVKRSVKTSYGTYGAVLERWGN